jgi:hypothetical protein
MEGLLSNKEFEKGWQDSKKLMGEQRAKELGGSGQFMMLPEL